VESFGVEKFPVVLAVAKGCGKAALVEEITAEKLIEGYKKAVKPDVIQRLLHQKKVSIVRANSQ